MSPGELIGLLGLAWARLFVYPGGLFALVLAAFAWRGDQRPPLTLPRHAAALPWLGLALLPLPFARPLGRGVDLLVVVALLEWPQLLALRLLLRSADPATRAAGIRRLAAELNGVLLLALAGLALATAAGTFDLLPMMRVPTAPRPPELVALRWLGALGLIAALPPLLGLGPFTAQQTSASAAGLQLAPAPDLPAPAPETSTRSFFPFRSRIVQAAWASMIDGLRLRALGFAALATLPWLGAGGALETEGALSTVALAACVLVPLALAGLLWAWARVARGPLSRWSWVYFGIAALLLGGLLVASLGGLLRR